MQVRGPLLPPLSVSRCHDRIPPVPHGRQQNSVPEEEKRCKIGGTSRHVEFSVDSPILGLRYTPVFRLARPGIPRDPVALRSAHHVLERTFTEVSRRGSNTLADDLSRQIEPELKGVLNAASPDEDWLGENAEWIALVWDEGRRLLLPAFGRFPRQSSNIRFGAGIGVAGQAFRFGFAAAWHHGNRDSLIYAPSRDLGIVFDRDYDWILALPILSMQGQAAVGVLSFAGTEHRTLAASRLFALAEDIVARKSPSPELANSLQNIIALQFWRSLSKHTELPQADRKTAEDILGRMAPTARAKKIRKPPKRGTRDK